MLEDTQPTVTQSVTHPSLVILIMIKGKEWVTLCCKTNMFQEDSSFCMALLLICIVYFYYSFLDIQI